VEHEDLFQNKVRESENAQARVRIRNKPVRNEGSRIKAGADSTEDEKK